jgi:hypothetical protein
MGGHYRPGPTIPNMQDLDLKRGQCHYTLQIYVSY